MVFLKKLYFSFQKINWYIGTFAGEYEKFGRFVNNYIPLITLLAVRNIQIPTWVIIVSYFVLMTAAAIGGKILIKMGILKYNTSLGNTQNDELIQIIADLKLIKEKLGI